MKKKLISGFMAVLLMGIVSASLLVHFGTVETTITVDPAVELSGDGCVDNLCESEATVDEENMLATTPIYTMTNNVVEDAPVTLVNSISPDDAGITHKVVYKLIASGVSPRENRIHIDAEDVGVSTLSDLTSITFEQDVVAGYVGHVDVLLDTTGDGVKDDALVFEYAKVDPLDCDDSPYPTGEMSTFGDKGYVDDSAYAWLTTGPAGGCASPATEFFWHSLADWKLGPDSSEANGKTVSGATAITAFEFEVDSWIMDSTAKMWDLKINGVEVELLVLQSSEDLSFYTETQFGVEHSGEYTLTTNVDIH